MIASNGFIQFSSSEHIGFLRRPLLRPPLLLPGPAQCGHEAPACFATFFRRTFRRGLAHKDTHSKTAMQAQDAHIQAHQNP